MELDFDRHHSYVRSRRRPRRRSRDGTSWRDRHRHLFAWIILGGGAVMIALMVFAGLVALGFGGVISSAYFGLVETLLPASWHDELHALPAIVHVAIGAAVVGGVVGIAGEIFD